MSDALGLHADVMPGVPVVELAGDRRVLIEYHLGITEYGKNQIGVRVSFGTVSIKGENLHLRVMSKERLVICGEIEEIRLFRRT
jgi:sporulation protein YqfC